MTDDRAADISLEVPSPLRECFLYCEVECVRECCGISAISTHPDLIATWGRLAGPESVKEAQRQLAELVAVVEDRSRKVVSLFLNHHTGDEAARRELLEFLAAFRRGLSCIARRETL